MALQNLNDIISDLFNTALGEEVIDEEIVLSDIAFDKKEKVWAGDIRWVEDNGLLCRDASWKGASAKSLDACTNMTVVTGDKLESKTLAKVAGTTGYVYLNADDEELDEDMIEAIITEVYDDLQRERLYKNYEVTVGVSAETESSILAGHAERIILIQTPMIDIQVVTLVSYEKEETPEFEDLFLGQIELEKVAKA